MNRAQRESLLFLVIGLGSAALLAACGGAESAPAKAPAMKSEPADEREPASVAEAQEQIERLSADIAGIDRKKAEAAADNDSSAGASTGAGGTSSTATARPSSPPGVREETASTKPADSCGQSCRALSSMRRAVSALCRMTGDEDARCSDAKKTLSQSESRVAQCHCNT